MYKSGRLALLSPLSLGSLACTGSDIASDGSAPTTSTSGDSTIADAPTNTSTADDGMTPTSTATTSTDSTEPGTARRAVS